MKKNIIVTLIAAAIAGTAGFFAGKKVYETKYANLAQEEIDSVKEAFGRRLDEIEADYAKMMGGDDDSYDPNDSPDPRDLEEQEKIRTAPNPLDRGSLTGNPYEQAKVNYNLAGRRNDGRMTVTQLQNHLTDVAKNAFGDKSEDGENDGPETDDADKTEAYMRDLTEVDRTQPYSVSYDEFSDEFPHHDKESIYYYAVDAVFCDEQEQPLPNIAELVGAQATMEIMSSKNVWARNEPLGIDYEIIHVNQSFAESVMGQTPRNGRWGRDRRDKTEDEE